MYSALSAPLRGGLTVAKVAFQLPLTLLVVVVLRTSAEVLLINLHDSTLRQLESEAIIANWNLRIDDSGQGAFAGELHYEEDNPYGCRAFGPGAVGRMLLIDAEELCDGFAATTIRAAESGAFGVIFFPGGAAPTPVGMALGDGEVPTIRAVMIHHRHGVQARDSLVAGRVAGRLVSVELRSGILVSDDSYEEHFIFRVDEFLATRATNFLWHVRPEMLPNSARIPLSSQIVDKGIKPPSHWFSQHQPFVPLFNPSVVGLRDGTLLASLRMSNGPGCPSVRRSRESSMDTRLFRNELVLAQINPSSLEVESYVFVETPPLVCRFTNETEAGGRKFLDEVSGPMDARIVEGEAGEVWVSFYAERNVPDSNEVSRGMHAAPLHIEWRNCSEAEGWELHARDGAWLGLGCEWLGLGDSSSSDSCQSSCDMLALECNAVSYSAGRSCVLRRCSEEAVAERFPGWSAWRRRLGSRQWLQVGTPSAPLTGECTTLAPAHGFISTRDRKSCLQTCESTFGCDSVLFSVDRAACLLQKCGQRSVQSMANLRRLSTGWEAWQWRPANTGLSPAATCLARAWIEPRELLVFPAYTGVEKNWNLIRASREHLVLEYHVEPHMVLEVELYKPPDGGIDLASMGISAVSRWPFEVIHGVTSARGGYCCTEVRAELWRGRLAGADEPAPGPLLLGCGHLQRIRTPFDQAPGDVDRFRRQAKSRTYHNFFYLLRAEPPFDVVAVSTEWCVRMNGRFSEPWRERLAPGEEACEAIQFASGLALRNDEEVLVSYGVNDCEADVMVMPLARVLGMLRPVVSATNLSLDDIEFI